MRNHDEKIKDMVESVLPSTSRKTARAERRIIHKTQRSRQRDMLRSITVEPDPDFGEGRRTSAISNMVWDRRAADKTGPLVRWAAAAVESDPALREADWPTQKAWFTAVLPKDLIGQHALTHIEMAIGPSATYSWMRRKPARPLTDIRAELTLQVRRILESGRHGELNIRLRQEYGVDRAAPWIKESDQMRPERLLGGLHDVEAFVDDVVRDSDLRKVVGEVAGRR